MKAEREQFLRRRAIERLTGVPSLLRDAVKGRIWFYKPEWYWSGRHSLMPFWVGHDEFSRRTLVVGWPWTGRAIIALWFCGDRDCYREAVEMILDGEAEPE